MIGSSEGSALPVMYTQYLSTNGPRRFGKHEETIQMCPFSKVVILSRRLYTSSVCKDLNIKDHCAKAWGDIREESLSHAWNKLLAVGDDNSITGATPANGGTSEAMAGNSTLVDTCPILDSDNNNLCKELQMMKCSALIQSQESKMSRLMTNQKIQDLVVSATEKLQRFSIL